MDGGEMKANDLKELINNRYLGTTDVKTAIYTVVITLINEDPGLSAMIQDQYKILRPVIKSDADLHTVLANTIADYVGLSFSNTAITKNQAHFMCLSLNIVDWVKVSRDLDRGKFYG